jgi:signal peptidase I
MKKDKDSNAENQDQEKPVEKSFSQRLRSGAVEWGKSILIAVVLALVIKATVVQSHVIPTESMFPTITGGDRVFANQFIYRFRDPRPGEIITFTPPPGISRTEAESRIPLVKRVIAVAGDTVEVKAGKVIRNGVEVRESFIDHEPCYDMPQVKVPEHDIFVLGDNRCNSYDSHAWGFLPRKYVRGQIFFRFWPPNRIGLVK